MSGLRIPVETKPAERNLRGLEKGFKRAGNAAVKSGSQMKGFRGAMAKMGKGLGGLARGLTSVKALIIGVAGAAGIGLLGRSFLQAATTTEGFQLRLQTLLGSAAAGNQMFKEMAEFASKVPFEFEMIMESATNLSGVMRGGIDEVKQWMPLIADLAAATGMPIEEATEQIQRMYSAGAASADKFREKGVLAMLGFQAGVSYSAEETREMLMTAWEDPESKFRGATDAMLDSWDGMMSMMGDLWTQFRNMVMTEGGVFDWMKSGLRIVLDAVNRLKDEGKLMEWANQVGAAVVNAFNQIVVAVGYAVDTFHALQKVWIGLQQTWGVFVGSLARGYELIQKGNLMLAESPLAGFGTGQDPAEIRASMNDAKEFADFQFQNIADLQKEWESIDPWGTATKQFTGYKDAIVKGAEEIKRKRLEGEKEIFVKPTSKKPISQIDEKVKAGFDKAFDKATLNPYQLEMKQLDELKFKYEEQKQDQIRIDQWYAAEREMILQNESERSIAEHKKMIEEMEAGYQTLFDDLVSLTDVIDNRLVDGFTSATMDFITGAKSMKQAFSEFSISFARDIGEMILKQTILNSLQGVMGGTGSGMFGGLMKMGASMFMADGGSVYGNRSYVVGENQAERFTSDRGGSRVVGANGPEMFKPGSKGTIDPSAAAPAPKVTIANLIDPSMISEYMNSSEGQDVIMNVISNQE